MLLFAEGGGDFFREVADGLADVAVLGDGVSECTAVHYLMLWLITGAMGSAGGSIEFEDDSFQMDSSTFSGTIKRHGGQGGGGVDALFLKDRNGFAAYAPYVMDWDGGEGLSSLLRAGEVIDALGGGVLFGNMGGYFCKGFSGGESYAYRDADPLTDCFANMKSECLGSGEELRVVALEGVGAVVKEGFVYAVNFNVFTKFRKGVHDSAGDVGVEGEVGGEGDDAEGFCVVFYFEVGVAHVDAELFCFFTAGDDASVVVGEDDDGCVFQVGAEEAFATGEEVVAIDEGEEFFH